MYGDEHNHNTPYRACLVPKNPKSTSELAHFGSI
jgi:hypothetical protein